MPYYYFQGKGFYCFEKIENIKNEKEANGYL